jgi:hypothetical protein
MLEGVDFFIREIGAIPVADTGRHDAQRPARRLRHDSPGNGSHRHTSPNPPTSQRILGHSELDLVTVQSYIDFYPLGYKLDFQRAYRAGLRDGLYLRRLSSNAYRAS